jgi:hypothetical protein
MAQIAISGRLGNDPKSHTTKNYNPMTLISQSFWVSQGDEFSGMLGGRTHGTDSGD